MEGGVKRVEGVLDVDLTDSPIVQYLHNQVDQYPILLALNAENWVQLGGLNFTHGRWERSALPERRLELQQEKMVEERLGVDLSWLRDSYAEYCRQHEAACDELDDLVKRVWMKEAVRQRREEMRQTAGSDERDGVVTLPVWYHEEDEEEWEEDEKDEVKEVPFEMNMRQRLITHFFSPKDGGRREEEVVEEVSPR
jgi:hypothetical protein